MPLSCCFQDLIYFLFNMKLFECQSCMNDTSNVFLNICYTYSSHIHKHMFLLSNLSPPQCVYLITLVSIPLSSLFLHLCLCLSPGAVCARCCELRKLYSSSSSSREREDTHERTIPHLPETAVLSRKYTSTEKKTREWASQGESE